MARPTSVCQATLPRGRRQGEGDVAGVVVALPAGHRVGSRTTARPAWPRKVTNPNRFRSIRVAGQPSARAAGFRPDGPGLALSRGAVPLLDVSCRDRPAGRPHGKLWSNASAARVQAESATVTGERCGFNADERLALEERIQASGNPGAAARVHLARIERAGGLDARLAWSPASVNDTVRSGGDEQ